MDAARDRDALIELLRDAYEDAGLRGLCGEGRWEAAIGAVRAADPAFMLQPEDAGSESIIQPGGVAMSVPWKPEGYNQVSPYLVVDGAAATIDFLINVFDAERLRHFADDRGRVAHAEVRVGDTVVMLGDGMEGWPAVGAHVHVYVPDVDATYRRALEHGAESVQEPVRKDDEDRRGGIKDPGGTTWWIATRQQEP